MGAKFGSVKVKCHTMTVYRTKNPKTPRLAASTQQQSIIMPRTEHALLKRNAGLGSMITIKIS